jgi:WD40 repeat protein
VHRRLTDIFPRHVGWDSGGRHLAVGGNTPPYGNYGAAGVWGIETDRPVFRKDEGVHRVGCNEVAFSRDGKLAALAWEQGKLQIVEVATGREVKQLDVPGAQCAAFSPDGSLLAIGTKPDSTLSVVVPNTGELRWSVKLGPGVGVGRVWYSPDGKRLIGSAWEGYGWKDAVTLKVWDAVAGAELRSLKGFYPFALDPAGQKVLGMLPGGATFASFDLRDGKQIGPALPTPYGWTTLVGAYSPDGRHAILGARNGTVHIYRLPEPAANTPAP